MPSPEDYSDIDTSNLRDIEESVNIKPQILPQTKAQEILVNSQLQNQTLDEGKNSTKSKENQPKISSNEKQNNITSKKQPNSIVDHFNVAKLAKDFFSSESEEEDQSDEEK
jgi:hypothetical protein